MIWPLRRGIQAAKAACSVGRTQRTGVADGECAQGHANQTQTTVVVEDLEIDGDVDERSFQSSALGKHCR